METSAQPKAELATSAMARTIMPGLQLVQAAKERARRGAQPRKCPKGTPTQTPTATTPTRRSGGCSPGPGRAPQNQPNQNCSGVFGGGEEETQVGQVGDSPPGWPETQAVCRYREQVYHNYSVDLCHSRARGPQSSLLCTETSVFSVLLWRPQSAQETLKLVIRSGVVETTLWYHLLICNIY